MIGQKRFEFLKKDAVQGFTEFIGLKPMSIKFLGQIPNLVLTI